MDDNTKVKNRSLPFFFLFCLTLAGCAQGGNVGNTGTGTEGASTAATGSGDASGTVGPVAAAGGREDVLGPRADTERVGQELFAVEGYYGPSFSHQLTTSGDMTGQWSLDAQASLDLPLRIQYATAMRSDLADYDWITNERGLQVRLYKVIQGETGNLYHYVDALTIGLQPEGHNVLFTGLDLRGGRWLEMDVFDPRHTRIPTEDFSASLREVPANMLEELRRSSPFFGRIPLKAPRESDIIYIEAEEGTGPRIPPPPTTLVDVPFLPIRRE